jgi:hypothetical protein
MSDGNFTRNRGGSGSATTPLGASLNRRLSSIE